MAVREPEPIFRRIQYECGFHSLAAPPRRIARGTPIGRKCGTYLAWASTGKHSLADGLQRCLFEGCLRDSHASRNASGWKISGDDSRIRTNVQRENGFDLGFSAPGREVCRQETGLVLR